MALARLPQSVDDAPAHQTKIAGVDGYRNVRQPAYDTVKYGSRQDFEAALAAAAPPRCKNDVVAGLIAVEKLSDEFGRILQIAVHEDNRVAVGSVEPRGRRDLMPEIARQGKHANVGVEVSCAHEHLTR